MDSQLPLFYYFCPPIQTCYIFPTLQPNTILHQNRNTQYQFTQKGQGWVNSQQLPLERAEKGSSDLNMPPSKEFAQRKSKKNLCFKKHKPDGDFKQRQQTPGRNLCSNTLKMYFKQLRDQNSQTFLNIKKIIEFNGLDYTPQMFIKKVNEFFPLNRTYISFQNVKMKCNYLDPNESDSNFAMVLRISMRKFYAFQIFTANLKSIRTTKRIRMQQIKQGKYFLRELTL